MPILSIFVNTAMNHANKVSSKYISAWLLAVLFTIMTVESKDNVLSQNVFYNHLTNLSDTTKKIKNKIPFPKVKQEKEQ